MVLEDEMAGRLSTEAKTAGLVNRNEARFQLNDGPNFYQFYVGL